MKDSFSKNDTLVVKGVAILAMMWHHNFLDGRFDDFAVSFWPLTQAQATGFASFLKICVSLFAFVTGYGLAVSLGKLFPDRKGPSARLSSRWILTRYLKSFSNYWFIVLMAWIVTTLINLLPKKIYFTGSVLSGVFYMLLDFLGLGQLFGTPLMVSTWWYMTALFVFIVSAPFLYFLMDRIGGIFCLAAFVVFPRIGGYSYPGGTDFFVFMPVFCIGMLFAKNNLFGVIETWLQRRKIHHAIAIIVTLCGTALCYKLSFQLQTKQFWDIKYDFFPVIYILLIYFTLIRIPVIKQVLRFLGKHSANIFWIHTFIRATYLKKFIYGFGHSLLIILVLLAMSLAISILVEALKKLLRYNKLFDRLIQKINTTLSADNFGAV